MTARLELAEWDAVWQRFYDRGRALHMTPNAAIHRADDETTSRHGPRPEQGAQQT